MVGDDEAIQFQSWWDADYIKWLIAIFLLAIAVYLVNRRFKADKSLD